MFYLILEKSEKGIPLSKEERILAWLGVVFLIVGIVFQAFSWFSITPSFLAPYSSYIVLGFALVGVILLAFLIGQRTKKIQPKKTPDISEGVTFYACRDDLPKLGEFLSQAKQEIWFMGVSNEKVIVQTADAFKKALERGVAVKFLFLNPESTLIKRWDAAMIPATKQAIVSTLERLCDLRRKFPKAEKEKCETLLYDVIPFNTFIVLDPMTDEAKIQVELYLYKTGPELRPSIIISKKEQKALFNNYWKSFQFVLKENSKKYECPE
jgi:hypothetical protein